METVISKTVSVKLDQKMREAINQYVDSEEMHEAFRQDTINAWNDYKKTGLHATAEDVEGWLNTWGTENELPAPVCRK